MTRQITTLAVSLVLAAFVFADDTPAENAHPTSSEGFIYGTVDTRTGKSYTGVLRWSDEEAFWDDIFHSAKVELPYREYAEEPQEDPDTTWWERMVQKVGGDLGVTMHSRVIAVRFGNLEKIEVTGSNDAVLTLRNGTQIEVSGYANDVGATIHARDAEYGLIEIPWKKIETISFAPTPADADTGATRLHGTVATKSGDFTGFIQWDSEEALSTDLLDGDTEDGRTSLEMGRIRSIERRNSRSAQVALFDGEELVLSGTNDVNDDIRGIHVEDPRYGRVEIPWDEFQRVDFDPPGGSGRGYADFAPIEHLSGVVTTRNGDRLTGRLVFDLDEEWSWEMLDGESFDLVYTLPFEMVASVEPKNRSQTLVRLRSGEELRLENSHDVDRENDGVLVMGGPEKEPILVPWREITNISFD
jgi:hypothetical protein